MRISYSIKEIEERKRRENEAKLNDLKLFTKGEFVYLKKKSISLPIRLFEL